MKPSRDPYGKCACAFTHGFTLTFPLRPGAERLSAHPVLRFDADWFEHFAPQPRASGASSLFSARRRA